MNQKIKAISNYHHDTTTQHQQQHNNNNHNNIPIAILLTKCDSMHSHNNHNDNDTIVMTTEYIQQHIEYDKIQNVYGVQNIQIFRISVYEQYGYLEAIQWLSTVI